MRLTSDSVLDGLPAGTSGMMNDYRRIVRRRLLLILLLALLIVASLLLDFMLGPSGLPLQSLWQTLTDPASADPGTRAIVWDIRLPYAVMAIIVGLALGLAGAEMQTILNNPLASPFTLGVSSAAAFGAALAIVLGIGLPGIPGQWFISANAFIFALLAALLLDGITRWTQVATSGVILQHRSRLLEQSRHPAGRPGAGDAPVAAQRVEADRPAVGRGPGHQLWH